MKIDDNNFNASKKFVRAELIPKDNNKASDINEWEFVVDQDITPDWFNKDKGRYEQEFREKVAEYIKKEEKFEVIAGAAWIPIKSENGKTTYIYDSVLDEMSFGNTNNYAESKVREYLNDSELLKKLKEELGDKLLPISLDLTSMDGFRDYGKVEGDYIAIPTIQLFMECGEKIPLVNKWCWLATPNQTPSRGDSRFVLYVDSVGDVSYRYCNWGDGSVRPFIVVQS